MGVRTSGSLDKSRHPRIHGPLYGPAIWGSLAGI